MMNRRNFLRMAAASGAASALRYPFSAYGQSDEIRFGCPVPLSGPFAANGKFADMGMKFALDEKGKLLGRNLGYTAIDTEGKPATAIRKVQEEMQQKGAHFFVGGILSSEALAMGKEIDKAGGVFLTTAGADEITGSECNRRHLPVVRADLRRDRADSAPADRHSCPRPSAGTPSRRSMSSGTVSSTPPRRYSRTRTSNTSATATTRLRSANSAATSPMRWPPSPTCSFY